MTTQYCQARRPMPGTARSFPCGAKAKVTRDGICYCGRHDPVAIKAAHDKREAVRKLERESVAVIRNRNDAARIEQARRAALFDELVALLGEVSACFTRDDDLPDELLPRIDRLLAKATP